MVPVRVAITLIGLCCLLGLSACSSPVARLNSEAETLGFQTLNLNADGFELTAFYQPGHSDNKQLHVYLEGDGSPWFYGVPASEPTTRETLMLPLMAIDRAPALYLSRPCYSGHANDVDCGPRLWTSARYGQQIINAMAIAIQDFSRQHGVSQLTLIGHSGGGSLALLLAGRLPQTNAVVTLAGNYDIDVWADYHGYQRLSESKNPANQANIGIPEWHFLGEQDRTVPPKLFFQALQRRNNSHVEIIPGIEHQQGWLQVWPELLRRLSERK